MMNKKFLVLTVLMLLVGMFAAGCKTGAGSSSSEPDIDGVVDKILEVGSLEFLGISDVGDNQLIAFIRIALAVLLFTLLYFGLSLVPGLGEQKSIKITVALILSIITAVFLPATILATFGGTYAGIFGFIIIGAPLAGVAWLLFATDTPGRFVAGLKFFGTCFAIWLVSEISYWANKLAGTSSLLDFSGFVAQFASWANIALWVVLIYFAFLWIKGGKEGTLFGGAGRIGRMSFGDIKDKFNKFTGREEAQKRKKLDRDAKREKTKLLSEYLEEQKELGLISKIQEKAKTFEIAVEAATEEGIPKKDPFLKLYTEINDAVGDAEKEVRRLKRVTFRQERRSNLLIKDLEEMGASKGKIEELKSLEAGLLKSHDNLLTGMEKIQAVLDKGGAVGKFIEKLKGIKKGWPLSPASKIGPITLKDFLHGGLLPEIVKLRGFLDTTKKEQEAAYKECEGLIAYFEKVWKMPKE